MKRESGENPEQTRCCESLPQPLQKGWEQEAAKITNATVRQLMDGKDLRFVGKVRRPATVSSMLMAFGNKA